jgi:1-deoxy-D-xylulose-5-phosphate reductoisomerase
MRISLTVLTLVVSGSAAFVVPDARSFGTTSALSAAISGSAGTGQGWIDPSAPVNSAASLRKTVKLSLEGSDGFQKRLSLLGSTGSIGTQTLEIVDACPENFIVDALSAGTNSKLMATQVLKYKPQVASMATPEAATELKKLLQDAGLSSNNMPEIMWGDEGILAAATVASADTVVTGIVGAAGLKPTIEAIKLKKDIALANKETLISGGPVINPLVEEYGVNLVSIRVVCVGGSLVYCASCENGCLCDLEVFGVVSYSFVPLFVASPFLRLCVCITQLPADSEHSAIFQCLQGVPAGGLRRVILTASGGAFRDFSKDDLFNLCENDPRAVQAKATTHPNWDMGAKITLDSATMMNKGLEVIEAHYLFGASYDDIDIVIHPQSIVHSLIETQDTSCLAQLGWADMRLPLVYSVSWPHRLRMPYKPLDLAQLSQLTFSAPDHAKYPCIGLAYAAGRAGGTMTAVLNAANEAANEMFRADVGLGFLDIPKLIEGAMEAHKDDLKVKDITLEDILGADAWAREHVRIATMKSDEKILII